MDFDNVTRENKKKTMHARKRKGKRDLHISHLKMEVLEPLSCRRRCLSGSGHVLSHPRKAVPTEPKRWETGEVGQPKESGLKLSRCNQEDPSRRKRS